jgi:hypothetical protein
MQKKGVVDGGKGGRKGIIWLGGKEKKIARTRVPGYHRFVPLLRVVVHVLKLIYQVVFRYFYVFIVG